MKTKKKAKIENVVIIALSVIILVLSVLLIVPMFSDEDESARVIDRIQIERRFLVDFNNIPWDGLGTGVDILQSYISLNPEIRLRNTDGSNFTFLLRTPIDEAGLSRQDIEFEISKEEYDELFQKISGIVVHKTRFRLSHEGQNIRVDIFLGELNSLVLAEVVFDSIEDAEAYEPLEWFGEEVTEDLRYRNAALSMYGLPK